MSRKILFATNNPNKVRELKSAFKAAGIDLLVISNSDLDNPPHVNENGRTFVDNAKLKAHALADFSHLPTIADDSGLVVAKLNGAPGVHSARYGGEAHNDARNNAKLLASLGGVPQKERQAKFVSTIVVSVACNFDHDLVVEGECKGEVLAIPRGEDGFGYDPLFYVPEAKKTFAEMTTAEKNKISHRGKAIKKLLQKLPAWLDKYAK